MKVVESELDSVLSLCNETFSSSHLPSRKVINHFSIHFAWRNNKKNEIEEGGWVGALGRAEDPIVKSFSQIDHHDVTLVSGRRSGNQNPRKNYAVKTRLVVGRDSKKSSRYLLHDIHPSSYETFHPMPSTTPKP